jgi:hypothetical protein
MLGAMIGPAETQLVGGWETISGSPRADAVANRINELTRTYLTRVAVSQDGWESLYRDPQDLRLWELTYPHGEMHGGGPAMLKVLSVQEAREKYKF